MAITFFVEIYQTQPNFSMKIDSSDVVSIYSSVNKDVAEQNNGKHKDLGYTAKIDACITFDCSGFISGRNAAGKIELCADCPAPVNPSTPNPAGNCASYAALNSYLNNLPAQVTNSNPATATAYATHLTTGTNAAGARSGYWLGLTDCDSVAGQYQCAVSCAASAVALCYPTLGAPLSFGSIQTLNGATYQIYDPVQLHAAGVSSTTGMSFAMGTSVPNWTAGGTCTQPAPLDLSGAQNCFANNPTPPANYNGGNLPPSSGYIADTTHSMLNGVFVSGVKSGSQSIGIGDQCFYIGGAPPGAAGGGLLFGGTATGGKPIVSLDSLGGSSHSNCQSCAENNPGISNIPCESFASSQISINGAPEFNNGSWGAGTDVWTNYNVGDPNVPPDSGLGFEAVTCAMDDINGTTHGPLGNGARAIVPNIPCKHDPGSKCKSDRKPGPIWVELAVSPKHDCCQDTVIHKIYQSFNNNCKNCCNYLKGSEVLAGNVFSGFGCPCDDENGDPIEGCICINCIDNLDCKKQDQGGSSRSSDPNNPDELKTTVELGVCSQYGNTPIRAGSGAGQKLGAQSWFQGTAENICSIDPPISCNYTFVVFFEISNGEVDLGYIFNDPMPGADPTVYPDTGDPVGTSTVGDLTTNLGRLGITNVSTFINVDSCHMAGGDQNPWQLYSGSGDVTVGGESANPSTPTGSVPVKPANDPNSPYGNNDDGFPTCN